jgi:hypothetical protein
VRAQDQRNVTVHKDQAMVVFDLILRGMIQQLVFLVPGHELAQILLDRSANLLGAIKSPAREVLTEQLVEKFRLSVETHNIAMRTTPAGIVIPEGAATKQ